MTLIHPPSMWTRKNVEEFKNEIKKDGSDTIMKVGHGETVTVGYFFSGSPILPANPPLPKCA